jgi:hypothetical protein
VAVLIDFATFNSTRPCHLFSPVSLNNEIRGSCHRPAVFFTIVGATLRKENMKRIKALVFGVIVGIALGIWFGFNLGQDRPLLSNPFVEPSFQESIKKTGEDLIEKGGEVLEKSGQALRNKAQDDEYELPTPESPPQ